MSSESAVDNLFRYFFSGRCCSGMRKHTRSHEDAAPEQQPPRGEEQTNNVVAEDGGECEILCVTADKEGMVDVVGRAWGLEDESQWRNTVQFLLSTLRAQKGLVNPDSDSLSWIQLSRMLYLADPTVFTAQRLEVLGQCAAQEGVRVSPERPVQLEPFFTQLCQPQDGHAAVGLNVAEAMPSLKIQIGPVELSGEKGLVLKPQLMLGLKSRYLEIGGGIGDMREGFSISGGMKLQFVTTSEGKCFEDLFKNAKLQTAVPGIGAVQHFLMENVSKFISMAGVDFMAVHMEMMGKIFTGISVDASVALGLFADAEGYRLAGMSGAATLGLSAGISCKCGPKVGRTGFRIIIGFNSCLFDIKATWSGDGKSAATSTGAGMP